MASDGFTPFLLSPLDHVFPPVLYATTVLYFRPERTSLNKSVEKLQCGLDRLIKIVPFLSGVVASATHPYKTNVLEVRPDTSSPSLALTCASLVQVKDYLEYGLPGQILADDDISRWASGEEATRRLMPDFERLTQLTTVPAPVFRAQINRLADGIALCLAVNHMVLDGKGNDMLLALLAQCCHDPTGASWSTSAAAAQVETRQYLHTLRGWSDEGPSLGVDAVDATVLPGEGLASDATSIVYNLVFSEERIQQLKRHCNARLPGLRQQHDQEGYKAGPGFVSSNDVLTALLWICASPVVVTQSPSSTVGVAVNSRGRFNPPLPDEYLGNSVAYANSLLNMSQLRCLKHEPAAENEGREAIRGQSDTSNFSGEKQRACREGCAVIDDDDTMQLLTLMAYRIRCSIADVNGPALAKLVASYYKTPDWSQILLQRCDVIVSSLNDWRVFALDFGSQLGYVDRVEFLPPSSPVGECILKPIQKEKAAVREVMVTLQPEQMRRMSQLSLLQWALISQSPTTFYRLI